MLYLTSYPLKTLLLPLALLAAPAQPRPAAAQASPAPLASPPPAWPDRSRLLPAKLRGVPTGLSLFYTPGLVRPVPDATQPGTYVWKHQTSVRAEVADLRILACGSFIWYDSTGWHANLHETPAEFAQLFNCPGGRLRKGHTYTFRRNYRFARAGQLYGGDALWYVLAKDARGRLYKGWAVVETEAGPASR
ncbi:hypothetical protein GO988_14710 [Hymenobacter sp. HMF4947]|uniref:Uncharacterized protein n=1 Tax=Hymenobacter ginkgonis TaxID=2682976 RepID=A0A7K1TGU5_9BACT|nr:hypothetical protein [Hymenobacter ginkgonis]MVN77583.1 hypothetical protein [Hymenobacter ginkgonis]